MNIHACPLCKFDPYRKKNPCGNDNSKGKSKKLNK